MEGMIGEVRIYGGDFTPMGDDDSFAFKVKKSSGGDSNTHSDTVGASSEFEAVSASEDTTQIVEIEMDGALAAFDDFAF